VVVLLALLVVSPPALAGESSVPLPNPAKAHIGDQCVEPVDVMRREHMNFLRHQRDETVRSGIRGNKYSLRGCVECHAVPDTAASGARTVRAFCSECHSYAAVSIDCFECHSNEAESKTTFRSPDGRRKPAKVFSGLGGSLEPTALVAEVARYLSERSAHNF
jgi:hypothetical protein